MWPTCPGYSSTHPGVFAWITTIWSSHHRWASWCVRVCTFRNYRSLRFLSVKNSRANNPHCTFWGPSSFHSVITHTYQNSERMVQANHWHQKLSYNVMRDFIMLKIKWPCLISSALTVQYSIIFFSVWTPSCGGSVATRSTNSWIEGTFEFINYFHWRTTDEGLETTKSCSFSMFHKK